MDQLIIYLLSLNKIYFDRDELVFQIQSHPSYPSLHAITGVLDHFNIDNLALDIPIDNNTLSQLPDSFLAQINTENRKDFVVVKKETSHYTLFYSNQKKENINLNTFLDKFTGIIVVIEKPEGIEFKKNNHSKINKVLLLSAATLFIILFVVINFNWVSIIYFLLAAVGIYISASIVKQEQGEASFLGDAFCSGHHSKKNCDAVLTSKGAQLGAYKLSDFSMVYFVGLLSSTWLLSLINSDLNSLFVMSLVAIPVTIYSIYYQSVVLKTWCLLCLSIVGVLWLQAALILFTNYNTFNFYSITGVELLAVGFAFLFVFTVWNLLKPNIKLIKELKTSKVKYFKFKRDFSLFNTLLNTSETSNTHIANTSEIVLGNKHASLEIVLVTSPFCGHCKPVHALIEQIINKHANDVKIIVRFSANEANTPLIEITSRLLEIYHTEGQVQCLEAMHDIYGDMDTETWLKKWEKANHKNLYLDILKAESDWCENHAINFTPAILINGKQYPKKYERSELIYFIEDLYENSNLINTPTLQTAL